MNAPGTPLHVSKLIVYIILLVGIDWLCPGFPVASLGCHCTWHLSPVGLQTWDRGGMGRGLYGGLLMFSYFCQITCTYMQMCPNKFLFFPSSATLNLIRFSFEQWDIPNMYRKIIYFIKNPCLCISSSELPSHLLRFTGLCSLVGIIVSHQ